MIAHEFVQQMIQADKDLRAIAEEFTEEQAKATKKKEEMKKPLKISEVRSENAVFIINEVDPRQLKLEPELVMEGDEMIFAEAISDDEIIEEIKQEAIELEEDEEFIILEECSNESDCDTSTTKSSDSIGQASFEEPIFSQQIKQTEKVIQCVQVKAPQRPQEKALEYSQLIEKIESSRKQKFVVRRDSNVTINITSQQDIPWHSCDLCGFLTKSKELIATHIKAHTYSIKETCERCRQKVSNMKMHAFLAHKISDTGCYYCKSCHDCFLYRLQFKQHILRCKGPNTQKYPCDSVTVPRKELDSSCKIIMI